MKFCKHIPTKSFSIRARRFHDNRVLLADYKVGQHNKIVFTEDPGMGTEPYYIRGEVVRQYGKTPIGNITCYAVPVDKLEPFELNDKCEHVM